MNRDKTKKAIEVMQAYVDGAEIEVKYSGFSKWRKFIDDVEPLFNWDSAEYRIKPKAREFWVSAFRYSTDQTERHCFDGKPSFGTWIKVREVL